MLEGMIRCVSNPKKNDLLMPRPALQKGLCWPWLKRRRLAASCCLALLPRAQQLHVVVAPDGRSLEPDFLLDGAGRSVVAPDAVGTALQAVNTAATMLQKCVRIKGQLLCIAATVDIYHG